jgi:hypothetical protein
MRARRAPVAFIILLVCLAYGVNVVYAPDIDLTQLPTQISNSLGISVFAAKYLAFSLMLVLFLIPCLFIGAKFDLAIIFPCIFVGFAVTCMGVALGWVDYWVLLIITLIEALMLAGAARNWITGHGGAS